MIRRWDTWKPYAAVAGGAMLVGIGGFLEVSARNDYRDYDAGIAECAANDPSRGCPMPSASLVGIRDAANTKRTLGAVGLVAGGLTVGTGIALVVLNRPRCYPIERVDGIEATSVAPIVTPDFVGVSMTAHF